MSRVLIIGYVWPEPESSAAGSRMMQLISFFLREDQQLCFATTASPTPFMADLESMGVETRAIELNNKSFDLFLQEFSPDLVLFDRFMMEEQFGWRVAQTCPRALRVLDTEDLHFLRKARQQATKESVELNLGHLQSETAKREVASIYRCDLSLIISETEMDLLQKEFRVPDLLLHYLPLLEAEGGAEAPSFEEREHFISIGNFRHEPNWDAVLQLKQVIWPLIRKALPSAQLHIYGAYPSQKVFELHKPEEGFLVKGRADSAREVLKAARLLLAPLRFGAGIKGKFLDAMSVGTPSSTSSTGAEAMAGNLPWGGSIADEPATFVREAVALYKDPDLWKTAQENGIRILQERFTSAQPYTDLKGKLVAIQEDPEGHRQQNFTGAMLQHHRVNSTRYLSKYIEVKNRLETRD